MTETILMIIGFIGGWYVNHFICKEIIVELNREVNHEKREKYERIEELNVLRRTLSKLGGDNENPKTKKLG